MSVLSLSIAVQILGVLIATLITTYVFVIHFVLSYWSKRGIVQDNPHTLFLQNLDVFRGKRTFDDACKEMYKKFKNEPVIGTYILFKPQLMIIDPDLIRIVLTKEFAHFHDRGLYFNEKNDPLTGHLIHLNGTRWKSLRGKLTPTFTSGKIKRMFPVVQACGNELKKYLEEKAEDREVIDTKGVVGRFTANTILTSAFGINSNGMANPNTEFSYWGDKALQVNMWKQLLQLVTPSIFEFFSITFMDKGVTNFFTESFKKSIEFRKANNIKRDDFFDLLMQLIDNGFIEDDENKEAPCLEDRTNGKITETEAIAQAFVFYMAGYETTSSAVTNSLFELAKKQELQDKLREEIRAALGRDGEFTYDNIKEMSYLHKVVSETLRKHPTLTMLSRICTKDIDLPNVNCHVKKDMKIIIPVSRLHNDPDFYPDPQNFDPERFSEENIAKRHPYAYLPFGEGPRACIGIRFGLLETKIGIVNALADLRFTLGPNTPEVLSTVSGTTLKMYKDKLYLRVEPV